MIKVTQVYPLDDEGIEVVRYINPIHIKSFNAVLDTKTTIIFFMGRDHGFYVKETPEEIIQSINHYKQYGLTNNYYYHAEHKGE